MSIKEIITIPDPALREKSLKVEKFDAELKKLVQDLKDTLLAQTDPPGVGLSAVQIGELKRVFVAILGKKIQEFVNPEILKSSKKQVEFLEGCLSIPEFYGHVTRPESVEVEAYNQKGERFQDTYHGLASRIIQHEIDHLNGSLFIDHVHAQNGKILKPTGKYEDGVEIFEEVDLT